MSRVKEMNCLGARALLLALLFALTLPIAENVVAGEMDGIVRITTDGAYNIVKFGDPEADEEPPRWGSRTPLDYESYVPMPLPDAQQQPAESLKLSDAPNQWISYDPATQEEVVHEASPLSIPGLGSALVAGRQLQGDLDEGWAQNDITAGGDTAPLNFSALSLITNPEDHPWRVNVKLYITFASGNYVGSGILIDATHVLTAGHCVHDIFYGGTWASAIVVVPAYDNGTRPYGDASELTLYSWTGWTVDANFDHDIGIIQLDRPIGALTGWHGYGYNDDPNYYTTTTFNSAGYPAASPYDGESMYYWYGDFDFVEYSGGAWYGNEVSFNSSAYGGQSGSGMYVIDGSDRTVYGVLSNGNASWTNCPRITSDKFSGIGSIISGNTPSSSDLIPLNVTTSPATVAAGDQLASMSYQVYNNASVSWSGTVNVGVYLSDNDNISTSDTLIQSHSFSHSFSAKSTVSVDVGTPPTIPAGTAGGSYYVGVILDIADHDTSNNESDGQDASTIQVTGDIMPPPAPVISSSTHPNESTWYVSDDPTFSWTTPSDASGIAGYSYLTTASSVSIPDTVQDTAANSATVSNLTNGVWYFHVRAGDNAGLWGATDHFRVQIDDTPPIIIPIGNDSVTAGAAYTGPTPTLSQSGPSPVTWTLVAGPGGMSINSGTGVVSWPNPTVSGSPHQVTIRATNVAGYDQESWQLTVTTNQAPVLATIGPKSVMEGDLLQFTVTATDPDGDNLAISVTNLPGGATFTDQGNGSANFSWQTSSGNAGIYANITFVATDDGTPPMNASETVAITVTAPGGGGGGGGGGCFLGAME